MPGDSYEEGKQNPLPALKTEVSGDWMEMQKIGLELQQLMTYYNCALMEVETKLKVLDAEYSLQYDRNPINSIKTRIKKLPSIIQKLKKSGCELTVASIEDNIYDVAGVRVICSFEEDVYTLVDALLRQDDITLIRKKDYIKCPKPNGYRSMHLIVAVPIFLGNEKRSMNVEIQIRTIAMDCWASLEHQLRYKKEFEFTDAAEQELFKCAILSAELDRRMDLLRAEMKL